MEKVIRVFDSFSEAEAADIENDLRRSNVDRIELLLHLREMVYGDAVEQGFTRVCRVIEREQS